MPSSAATGNSDPRVQAIRCTTCNRLRPHPTNRENISCLCGGRKFVASFPLPGEEQWALTIYEEELRERELWRLS